MADVSEFQPGTYLTDGHKLYRVIRAWAPSGQVLLEDCGDPGAPSQAKSVRELAADGVRHVTPKTSAISGGLTVLA